MSLRMKYFPQAQGNNQDQAATMNAALAAEMELDVKPTGMITAKNRAYEFFIEKAKAKNMNPISSMSSLGLNSQKALQFFKGDHRQVEFLRLLHAITMLGYEVNISFEASEYPFGKIDIIE